MSTPNEPNPIIKKCLQCGEEGHHYNECPQFFTNLCGAFGVPNILGTQPFPAPESPTWAKALVDAIEAQVAKDSEISSGAAAEYSFDREAILSILLRHAPDSHGELDALRAERDEPADDFKAIATGLQAVVTAQEQVISALRADKAELARERDLQKGRIFRLEREAIETRDLCELTPSEDEMIQELATLRAASATHPDTGWQTMATAPRDGSLFLAYIITDANMEDRADEKVTIAAFDSTMDAFTQVDSSGNGYSEDEVFHLWMALPVVDDAARAKASGGQA